MRKTLENLSMFLGILCLTLMGMALIFIVTKEIL